MGGLECVITGLMDEFSSFFKKRKYSREIFTFIVILVSFSVGMINVTPVSGFVRFNACEISRLKAAALILMHEKIMLRSFSRAASTCFICLILTLRGFRCCVPLCSRPSLSPGFMVSESRIFCFNWTDSN